MGLGTPNKEEEDPGLDEEPSWEPLQSTHVSAIKYNHKTKMLSVLFQDGAMWDYANVPPTVYESFLTTQSPGRFMASEVKGRFSASRAF